MYLRKFRIYYQEYDPKKHLNLERQDWGIGADGDHSEYDVMQCPAGTPPSKCTNLNQGTWMPHAAAAPGQPGLHLVKAHFHCHAPTCLRMELWNNDTGKLLCREEVVHGGTGQLDLHKFDEKVRRVNHAWRIVPAQSPIPALSSPCSACWSGIKHSW